MIEILQNVNFEQKNQIPIEIHHNPGLYKRYSFFSLFLAV